MPVSARTPSAATGTTRTATETMRCARVFMPSHDGDVPSNARPTRVVGRHLTALLPPRASSHHDADLRIARRSGTSTDVAAVGACPGAATVGCRRSSTGDGPVVALRRRPVRRPRRARSSALMLDSAAPGQRPRPARAGRGGSRPPRCGPTPRRSRTPRAPAADRPGGRPQPGGRRAGRPQRPPGLGGQRSPGSAAATCPRSTASASTTATARPSRRPPRPRRPDRGRRRRRRRPLGRRGDVRRGVPPGAVRRPRAPSAHDR